VCLKELTKVDEVKIGLNMGRQNYTKFVHTQRYINILGDLC